MQQKKIDIVSSLRETMTSGGTFVLVQFEKTTHQTLEGIRKSLKKQGSKLQVIKNTLFEKTINKLAIDKPEYRALRTSVFPLKEKSAVIVFGADWVESLKSYYKQVKENESFKFKFGVIDKTVYDASGLERLAQLPSKAELVAKLLGSMQNPASRTTRALKFNAQKLVYVLHAKASQSESA